MSTTLALNTAPDPVLRRAYRAFVPRPLRAWVRTTHRGWVFSREFAALRRDPAAAARDLAGLQRLSYGWGNDGWSAHPQYLARCITSVLERPGCRVLECGSGLSTLVMGAAVERVGGGIWSLEHTPAWRDRVQGAAASLGLTAVTVLDAPLRDWGAFDWYTPPPALPARGFDLVVCDGPPADTRGGRYGALPVMRERLAPGCLVLLDDAARDGERETLARWTREFGGAATIVGVDRMFAEYTP